MGAAVSIGENNDDLIDKLVEANYIKTSQLEHVFRVVDRGAYFLPNSSVNAYQDAAWRDGNYHISAPCIYCEVMEGLKLEPGLSFLNLGSGTGYLSTIAGLILGSNGINHGIELHEDVVKYAQIKLEEFKKYSCALDEFDFCEPKFMVGNCLCLSSDYPVYDRVYCGAACPEKYLSYIKCLVKVGGILIVPMNDDLFEMKRVTESIWSWRCLLPVSFTSLVRPLDNNQEIVPQFEIEPLTLQELCRSTIRRILREVTQIEHPFIERDGENARSKLKKQKIPSSSDDHIGRCYYNPRGAPEDIFDSFLFSFLRRKQNETAENEPSTSHEANNNSNNENCLLGDPLDHMQNIFEILNRFDRSQRNPDLDNPEVMVNNEINNGGASATVVIEIGKRDENVQQETENDKNEKKRNCDDESDNETEYIKSMKRMKMYISPYSRYMEYKIQQLPLPSNVKNFLHYYKHF